MPVERDKLERQDDATTDYYESIPELLVDNPDQAFVKKEIENRVGRPNWYIRFRLFAVRYHRDEPIEDVPVDVITTNSEKYYALGE